MSIWPIPSRGLCVVSWIMNQRSCLTRILNLPLYRELLNSASRNRPSPASERARGSTGLVKIICKENKEQRGKRKYHDGTPHPKDRGGFAQWFGSCSLINTLYVWFPASWAPIVAEQLFEKSSNSGTHNSNIQHGQPARGLSQNPPRGHAWHQATQEFAGPSVPATEAESNEVMYKILIWSLPGSAVMPVLNVSSRVTWLELDVKSLLDSYDVLQEGILCDVKVLSGMARCSRTKAYSLHHAAWPTTGG